MIIIYFYFVTGKRQEHAGTSRYESMREVSYDQSCFKKSRLIECTFTSSRREDVFGISLQSSLSILCFSNCRPSGKVLSFNVEGFSFFQNFLRRCRLLGRGSLEYAFGITAEAGRRAEEAEVPAHQVPRTTAATTSTGERCPPRRADPAASRTSECCPTRVRSHRMTMAYCWACAWDNGVHSQENEALKRDWYLQRRYRLHYQDQFKKMSSQCFLDPDPPTPLYRLIMERTMTEKMLLALLPSSHFHLEVEEGTRLKLRNGYLCLN
jgi:hypothetical protein